jgi:hypothetical protein
MSRLDPGTPSAHEGTTDPMDHDRLARDPRAISPPSPARYLSAALAIVATALLSTTPPLAETAARALDDEER